MTPKEYLKQVYFLTKAIEEEKEEIKMIRACMDGMTGMGYDKEMVKETIPVSGIETNLLKIEHLEHRISIQEKQLEKTKKRVNEGLNRMTNEREVKILTMKYLDFMSWDEIVSDLKISRDAAYSLHKRALSHFRI